jgi:hypothetical protein
MTHTVSHGYHFLSSSVSEIKNTLLVGYAHLTHATLPAVEH